jgi:hypothetical protein
LEKKHKSRFHSLVVERKSFLKKKYFFLKKKLKSLYLSFYNVFTNNDFTLKKQTQQKIKLLFTNDSRHLATITNVRTESLALNLKNQLRLHKITSNFVLNKLSKVYNISVYSLHQTLHALRKVKVLPLTTQIINQQTKTAKYKPHSEDLQQVLASPKIYHKNKNIYLQKKINKNLHTTRYFFLNFFIFFNKTQRQYLNDIEMYQISRIRRRF